ncbi:MAG: hypothetical protein WAW02_15960 [Sideroxyarcus sp.]
MNSFRMQLLLIASIVATGILLTGYDKVHWFLYAPVVMLTFAAITGFCPGLILLHKLGFKHEPFVCSIPKRKD